MSSDILYIHVATGKLFMLRVNALPLYIKHSFAVFYMKAFIQFNYKSQKIRQLVKLLINDGVL